MPDLAPALPEGAVLAHVGLHKTGTTALQSALGQQREQLARLGVAYPGPADAHHGSALALTGTPWGGDATKGRPPAEQYWTDLVAQVRAAPGRAVVSSEFFADARGAAGERFVRELGADRLHVLVCVRHLAGIIPSHWQQTLKAGRVSTFAQWTDSVLLGPRDVDNPRAFWSRYAVGATVRRWASWVGTDRVSVVVVDPADRAFLPGTFEALLSLLPGTLADVRPLLTNRSLSPAEAEGLRQLNVLLRDRVGWAEYERVVRHGAVRRLQEGRQPGPHEPQLVLPQALVDLACEHGATTAAELRATGVRVLGDLRSIVDPPRWPADRPRPTTLPQPPDQVPADAFALALAGAAAGALGLGHELPVERPPSRPEPLVHRTGSGELLRVVAARAKRRLTGRRR